MKIVIAGAGEVGFHLAKMLAHENQHITLIDTNVQVLEYVSNHLDVLTVFGDASSINVLNEVQVGSAHLFIAATTSETTNLLSSILAKRLGVKMTIARVSNVEYLNTTSKEYFNEVGIDHLICPSILAANEIKRLISSSSFTDIYAFEKGEISIIGFTVDNTSILVNKSFEEIDMESPELNIKTFCILRNGETLIPSPHMRIQRSDHVYLVTSNRNFKTINDYIGKTLKQVKRLMIIGGTSLAFQTAKLLEDDFSITMVVKEEDKCKEFVSNLDKVLVINGDWGNLDLLQEEGLEKMDAFIALTNNAETNIINCITAEQAGIYKTISLVDNSAYIHVSQNIGIDTLINKKLIAANNIFRYVRKGKVQAIASLHGVAAEIIEFEIHKNNRLTKVPISELHVPKDGAMVIGVIREDSGIIPVPDFQLQVGDKVVVFVLLHAIKKVENIFR